MKSLVRVFWIVVVALLPAPAALRAQTVVAGQVVNRGTRVPLARVLVELIDPADSVLAASTSGADGTFGLAAPAAGTYRVRLTPLESDAFVSDTLTVAQGEYFAREFAVTPSPKAFFDFQVDRPVLPTKSYRAPRYPDSLRQMGVQGCALVQYVVDETGRADLSTFRALMFSRIEFVESIRAALPSMEYTPAELGGRKVRQLVQQPFTFSITGGEFGFGTAGIATQRGGLPPGGTVPPDVPVPHPQPMPAKCGR